MPKEIKLKKAILISVSLIVLQLIVMFIITWSCI